MIRNESVTRKPEVNLSDRISQVMGQNLLQGFALLDEYCPHCSTPLMRDPQKNLCCVACTIANSVVKTEKKVDSKIAQPLAPNPELSRDSPDETVPQCVTRILISKLKWASAELENTNDVSQCIDLNILIKGLLESIKLLNEVK